jgi:signal transduction histidine kinase
VTVRISDDGGGGSPAPAIDAPSGGFGLLGMRERVEATGGTLDAHPRQEGGFEVVAAWGGQA